MFLIIYFLNVFLIYLHLFLFLIFFYNFYIFSDEFISTSYTYIDKLLSITNLYIFGICLGLWSKLNSDKGKVSYFFMFSFITLLLWKNLIKLF